METAETAAGEPVTEPSDGFGGVQTLQQAVPGRDAVALAEVLQQGVDSFRASDDIEAGRVDAALFALEVFWLAPRRAVRMVQRHEHQHARTDECTIAVAVANAIAPSECFHHKRKLIGPLRKASPPNLLSVQEFKLVRAAAQRKPT